jgi:hypothetical protein
LRPATRCDCWFEGSVNSARRRKREVAQRPTSHQGDRAASKPFSSRFGEQPVADAGSAHAAQIQEDMADTASGCVADREGRGLSSIPSAAVQLKKLLSGHGRAAEGADHSRVMDTSLDRWEISLLRQPQADKAVAEWRVRNRKRGDEDGSRSSVLRGSVTAGKT